MSRRYLLLATATSVHYFKADEIKNVSAQPARENRDSNIMNSGWWGCYVDERRVLYGNQIECCAMALKIIEAISCDRDIVRVENHYVGNHDPLMEHLIHQLEVLEAPIMVSLSQETLEKLHRIAQIPVEQGNELARDVCDTLIRQLIMMDKEGEDDQVGFESDFN